MCLSFQITNSQLHSFDRSADKKVPDSSDGKFNLASRLLFCLASTDVPLHIVTAPIFAKGLLAINRRQITIPDYS